MPFDFAALKSLTRQTVHDVLAVEAFYKSNATSTPKPITARWHEKKVLQGQMDGEGAQVLEGIDHVVFNIPQLLERKIKLSRGGIIIFKAYENFTVTLDNKILSDGPVEEKWAVTRTGGTCPR
jgi:hypothetical protein